MEQDHTTYCLAHSGQPTGLGVTWRILVCICHMPPYIVEHSHLVFILSFHAVLLFPLSSFFPSLSQWSLEFISIRLPSGFLEGEMGPYETIHRSNRTFPMHPTNSKCKKLVVCSHQCHKPLPKFKLPDFLNLYYLRTQTLFVWKLVKENSKHNEIHVSAPSAFTFVQVTDTLKKIRSEKVVKFKYSQFSSTEECFYS